MPISYPDFRADPNSVPKIKGIPGIFENFQKGYMMAQLPEKLKRQAAIEKANIQKTQAQADLYGSQADLYRGQASIYDPHALDWLVDSSQTQATSQQPPPQAMQEPDTQAMQSTGQIPYRLSPSQEIPPQGVTQAGMTAQQAGNYQPSGQEAPQYIEQQAQSPYYGDAQIGNQPKVQAMTIKPGDPRAARADQFADSIRGARYLKAYGIGKETKIVPLKDGSLAQVTTYPSGKQTMTRVQIGETPQKQAFDVEMAKIQAKAFDDTSKSLESASQANQLIREARDALDEPAFKESVGAVNSVISRMGQNSPEAQRLTGATQAIMGEVQAAKAAALSLGGSAAAAKLKFVERIKPSERDTYYSYVGKLEALNTFEKWREDISRNLANKLGNGVRKDIAITMANKEVPIERYKGQILSQMRQGEIAGELKEKGMNVKKMPNGKFYVSVPTPDGKGIAVNVEQYEDYMKQYAK